ncbi:MAG: hypothetical protein DRJ51_01675 [Thermoprotei archaeon]|nr:MAG: hypothetical protein DRJ36_03120 [Thermoprotei archaeon]RLE82338.1 MAG: hypothetical protein DRJ51_01675 [Thermoprotei archaeon]RLF03277.1 MAG: hypothetical protein DRJ59_01100 [Thermoprotei archaeon]
MNLNKGKVVYVLDASFFINLPALQIPEGECYTTPLVVDELKDSRSSLLEEVMSLLRALKIMSPSKDTCKRVEVVSRRMNLDVSRADISVLALALMLKEEGKSPIILSDDYGIMSIAEALEIKFNPITTRNFKRIHKVITYCPVCGRTFKRKTICPICGVRLRRKLKLLK